MRIYGSIENLFTISSYNKYGDPEIYDSPVDTTTYSWYVGDCEIELADYTGNDQFLKVFGAYEIIIYY